MKTIITIGRQYGSAGHSIGKILADDLGIKYQQLFILSGYGQLLLRLWIYHDGYAAEPEGISGTV